MFDNLEEQLEKMESQEIAFKISIDDNHYLDRRCPNLDCGKMFKINFDDWKDIIKNGNVHCPICRFEKPSNEWNTLEQLDYLKNIALNTIKSQISTSIQKDVKNFNSKKKSGFVTMALSYKPGKLKLLLPPEVAKEL